MILNPAIVIAARVSFVKQYGKTANAGFETTQQCEDFFDEGVIAGNFTETFFQQYAKRGDS